MIGMRRLVPTLTLLLALALPCEGGAAVPAGSGGATYVPPSTTPKRKAKRPARKRKRFAGPRLSAFAVGSSRLFLHGRPVRVSFRINARAALTDVRLYLVPAGSRTPAATLRLGARPRGVTQSVALTGQEAALADGSYSVRVAARDARGRRMRRRAGVARNLPLAIHGHRFPLVGPFSYGGADSRFGAGRRGHSHQGQDLAAAEGTPVVAPRGGVVEAVAYQAAGAGHYVVLDGAGEDRDYVFMHLVTGSIPVRKGQTVRTGQRIGQVGNTGRSFGAHLHFEVWDGLGWYAGGKPIDPLPLLRSWPR